MDVKKNIDSAKVKKILNMLLNRTSNRIYVLKYALQHCNYYELESLYEKTPKLHKGLFSLSFLRRKKLSDLSKTSIFVETDVVDITGKICFILSKHSLLINQYIKQRREVDKLILLGKYEDAKKIISEIDNHISYSYWSCVYKIKIERLLNGVSAAIRLHNMYHGSVSNSAIKWFFNAAFFTSPIDYTDDIKDRLFYKDSDETSNYYNQILQSHFFGYDGVVEGAWMSFDLSTSIIDLYNSFLIYLPNLSEKVYFNNDFRYFMSRLISVIDDSYLKKICTILGIVEQNQISPNVGRVAILNDYLLKKYLIVQKTSLEYLNYNPLDMDILMIYLKSSILLGENLSHIDSEGNLYQKIRYHLFSLLQSVKDSDLHLTKLKGICKAFYHIEEIRHLYSLVSILGKNLVSDSYRNIWKYSRYSNPLDSLFYSDFDDRKDFLFKIGLNTNLVSRIFNKGNDDFSSDYYELSIGFQKKEEIVNLLQSDFDNHKIVSFMQNPVAEFLFCSYVENHELEKSIIFYVDYYLNTDVSSITVSQDILIDVQRNNENLLRSIPLELSIFYCLNNVEVSYIYLAYKRYLKSMNVLYASDIIVHGDRKQDFFLATVATQRVLTLHVLRFQSVEEVMDERLKICSNLYEYYEHRKYADEVAGIVRDKRMLELNNKIDDNKIYVDIQSIKDNELEQAKLLYKMYAQASPKMDFLDVSVLNLVKVLEDSGLKVHCFSEALYSNRDRIDYQYDILKHLFLYVRNQFLSNPKSGLDNYLSTRIRHGTLINQLRNHFEKENLICNKKNGKYSDNFYWTNQIFQLYGIDLEQCETFFISFSKSIDDIIFDLKDEYVQIHTEELTGKPNGCFDFQFCYFEDDLKNLQSRTELNTYDSILSEIFNLLWCRTDICLDVVKEKLAIAQRSMLEELHKLQKNVASIIHRSNRNWSKFNDSIARCSSDIQLDFQAVNRWFNRSSSVDFDFTILQVIETCKGFINNSKFKFMTDVDCQSDSVLRGKYFTTLYDMFYDILNNAWFYEKEHLVGEACKISIIEINNRLDIRVSNKLAASDIELMSRTVNEINLNLDNLMAGGKTCVEGKSGCIKIFNAVYNHLGSKRNTYCNSVENGEFIVKISLELNPLLK